MSTPHTAWKEYIARELPIIAALLAPYHIILSSEQPHIKGERFLIQALTTISGQKLILLGKDTNKNQPVVIKVSNDYQGKQELKHERSCRHLLHSMNFSYDVFHSPKEILFLEIGGYVVHVAEYIEQTSSFLERPLKDQFFYALRALKTQEQTRATTAKHLRTIHHVFGTRTSADYLLMTEGFIKKVATHGSFASLLPTLTQAQSILIDNRISIEQYGGFLTHTDFVPHNFRIKDKTLYLLDFSSLRFGNKHESWARFLNFMTLHNPELETLLTTYVKDNRSVEEQKSLHLMRLFRLTEIIAYYTGTLKRSSDSLLTLNTTRVHFWNNVLEATLQHKTISDANRNTYKTTRDTLRSEEEKQRQIGLH